LAPCFIGFVDLNPRIPIFNKPRQGKFLAPGDLDIIINIVAEFEFKFEDYKRNITDTKRADCFIKSPA
jgi:hypothetical protein